MPAEKAATTEQIINDYYHDIYKFCCARCRNADDAQDLTQETFTYLIKEYENLNVNNIRAWLLSVADKKILEYFRQIKVERSYVSIYDVEIPSYDSLLEESKPVEEEIFDNVQQKILGILNEKERELFVKFYVEKKSITLVSEELGITPGNARVRKSRLKKKITDSVKHTTFLMMVVLFKLNS